MANTTGRTSLGHLAPVIMALRRCARCPPTSSNSTISHWSRTWWRRLWPGVAASNAADRYIPARRIYHVLFNLTSVDLTTDLQTEKYFVYIHKGHGGIPPSLNRKLLLTVISAKWHASSFSIIVVINVYKRFLFFYKNAFLAFFPTFFI